MRTILAVSSMGTTSNEHNPRRIELDQKVQLFKRQLGIFFGNPNQHGLGD